MNIIYFILRWAFLFLLAVCVAICKHKQLIHLFSILQGHLYIIDVSQAVDLDHPHALDFLREDSVHVSVSYIYKSHISLPLPHLVGPTRKKMII